MEDEEASGLTGRRAISACMVHISDRSGTSTIRSEPTFERAPRCSRAHALACDVTWLASFDLRSLILDFLRHSADELRPRALLLKTQVTEWLQSPS